MATSVDLENLSAAVRGNEALQDEMAAPAAEAEILAQAAQPGAQGEPVPVDAGSGQPLEAQQPSVAAPAEDAPAEYVADASNVVHLPANVSIDNIEVDGQNLVLEQADGSVIVIKDAASNVPTFMLGDVEVPRVALIAALEAGGINIAFGADGSISAGPSASASSSGGDFNVSPGGIGSGFDLSALLPPTALQFPQYEVRDLLPGLRRNRAPEISDLTPQVDGGDVTVYEADLDTEVGAKASDYFTVKSLDGIKTLTVHGEAVVTNGVFTPKVITTPLGNKLSITGYDPVSGKVSYTYTLTDNEAHPDGGGKDVLFENLEVRVIDNDGDTVTGTLTAGIVDDVPVAKADSDTIGAGQSGADHAATGNVISGEGTTEGTTNADVQGADGASVSAVESNNPGGGASQTITAGGSVTINGQYGVLTLHSDGTYSYVRTAGTPGGKQDVFTYTLKDGDTDTDTATLTIKIDDSGVTVTTPGADSAGTTVHEAGLPARGSEPAGSNEAANSETTSGSVTFTSPDGVQSIEIGGQPVSLAALANATLNTPVTVANNATGTLVVTGYSYNAATGAGSISYSYTLKDNTSGDTTSAVFTIKVTDLDGDSKSGDLTIKIVDDVPVAKADSDTIGAGQSGADHAATGNVISGEGTTEGTTNADVQGADGASVSAVESNNPGGGASQTITAGGSVTINGQYGVLTLHSDGTYSYVRTAGTPGGKQDVFTYTLKDGDTDTDTATLTIKIDDSGVTVTTPGADSAGTTVHEAGLPARGSEPAGSNEAANSETTSGSVTFTSPDGVQSIEIGGQPVSLAALANATLNTPVTVANNATGTLVVTGYSYNAATGAGSISYSYTLKDNTSGDTTSAVFTIKVTDLDGDSKSGDLTIKIVDDVPVAKADSDTIGAGQSGADHAATGNVISGEGTTEGTTNADVQGADGASVSAVESNNPGGGASQTITAGGSVTINGQYGVLTLHSDGTYSYVRTAGTPGGKQDVFTYTLKDGDTDTDTATLTIKIDDSGVTVTTPGADSAGTTVHEAGLPARGSEPAGSNEAANSETTSGSVTFTSPDGVQSIEIGGQPVSLAALANATLNTPVTVANNATGTLVVTGYSYNAATGAGSISYSYTLKDNTSGDTTSAVFTIKVTDLDGDSKSGDLTIKIVDDAPVAKADSDTIGAGQSGADHAATGNVISGEGTTEGTTNADVQGADGASVSAVESNNPGGGASQTITAGGSVTINGQYGVLTLHSDGTYSYVRTAGTPGGKQDVFTYTLKDGDTDTDTATLTIKIDDSGVTVTTPGADSAGTTVHEAGLPARGSEPAGSNEAANSETTSGSVTFTSPDGVQSIEIGGQPVSLAALANATLNTPVTVANNATGTLVVTGYSYNAATGAGSISYSYTLKDNTSGDTTSAVFTIKVTDLDGDSKSGDLTIKIVDDAPVAKADSDTIGAGQSGADHAATGNVISGEGTTEGTTNADVQGADGASVSAVESNNPGGGASQTITAGGSVTINGQYGVLTLHSDGTYSYVRTAGTPGGKQDVFTYTLKDGDTDTDTATLTIKIDDSGVTVTTPGADSAGTTVHEAGLPARGSEPAGSNEAANSETTSGSVTFTSPDGVQSIEIGGQPVSLAALANATLNTPVTVANNATGTLVVTGYSYNAATGAGSISYSYTLKDNTSGDTTSAVFTIKVTDLDGDSKSGDLTIKIVDDAPVAKADSDTIGAGQSGADHAATGNVISGEGTTEGTTNADVQGADGASVSAVESNNPGGGASQTITAGGSVTINGQYGVLTLHSDGTYSYVRTAGTPGGKQDVFTYTLKDGDTDTDTATLTIKIDDSGVTVTTPGADSAGTTVHEAGLPARGSEPAGSNEAANSETTSGSVTFTSPDGVQSIEIGGQPVSLAALANATLNTPVTVANNATGTLVVTGYSYNAATGAGSISYSYTLKDNTSGDTTSAVFTIKVTDLDGDSKSGDLTIKIVDDVPVVTVSAGGSSPLSALALGLDETVQPNGGSNPNHDRYRAGGEDESGPSGTRNGGADDVSAGGSTYVRVPTVSSTVDASQAISKLTSNLTGGLASLFSTNVVFGADGPAAQNSQSQALTLVLLGGATVGTTLSVTALAGTSLAGLSDAARQIYLTMENGAIVGRVPGADGIGSNDAVAFRITVANASTPGSAQIVVEQYLPIDHGGTENPSVYDEVLSLLTTGDSKVQLTLTVTATDGDGDVVMNSASVDLVNKNTSAISFDDDGPIALTDSTPNIHTVGNSANAIVHGDIKFDYGTDGQGTPSISMTTSPASLSHGGTALIYSNATPNVLIAHTGNPNDPVFKLTLDPATGNYTFQSFKTLDGVTHENVSIGGAFGAGPTSYQVLTNGPKGTGEHLAVVSGWKTGAGFNLANWKAGEPNPFNGITVAKVNGGTNGWGVDDQNFEPGKILRFDFGEQVDFDGGGSYVPPGAGTFNGPDVSKASFSLASFGSSDTIHYVVHYTDGTSASAKFDVSELLGKKFEPVAPPGKYLDYVEFYIEDGKGKLDLESVTTTSTTVDVDLDFNVTVRDGDGDAISFPIHIDIVNAAPTAGAVNALIDEDALAGGLSGGLGDTAGTAVAAGTLAFNVGPSGAAAADPVNFSPMHNLAVVDTDNAPIKSGGVALAYFWNANTDTLYGATDVSSAANAAATAVFKITLNTSTGVYGYTQIKPLDHPEHDDPASQGTVETSYEDSLDLAIRYQVNDADGDSAQGTLVVTINDDTPEIASVEDGSMLKSIAGSVHGIIDAGPGADGPAATPFQFTADYTKVAGLTYTLSNNDTLLTAKFGTTTVYTVQLNANGSYDFKLAEGAFAIKPVAFSDVAAAASIAFADSGVTISKLGSGGGNIDPYAGGFGVVGGSGGANRITGGEGFVTTFAQTMDSVTLNLNIGTQRQSSTSSAHDDLMVTWTAYNSATGVSVTGNTGVLYDGDDGSNTGAKTLTIDPAGLPQFDRIEFTVVTQGATSDNYRYMQVTGLTGNKATVDLPNSLDFTVKATDRDADTDTEQFTISFGSPTLTVGSNANDKDSSTEDHIVQLPGVVDGAIVGTTGPNIQFGDAGGVDVTQPQHSANIVLVLDASTSMNDTVNGVSRLSIMKTAVQNLLESLSGSGATDVKVHIVQFGTGASTVGTYTLIQNGSVQNSELTNAKSNVGSISISGAQYTNWEAGLNSALNWINSSGGNSAPITNATTKQVIFISDGDPTAYNTNTTGSIPFDQTAYNHVFGQASGDTTNEPALIKAKGYTIEAVGILLGAGSAAMGRLNDVEDGVPGSGGGGAAQNINTAAELEAVLQGLNPLVNLKSVGADTITAGEGNDIIFGDAPNTDALAASLGLTTKPGSGWDVFAELEAPGGVAWTRADTMDYITKNMGTLAQESVAGGTGRTGGNDTIDGGAGNDIIFGQEGNDTINGGAGSDILFGGTGNDILIGGTGDDILIGGAGQDTMTGGAGADTFVIGVDSISLAINDIITDFNPAEDQLDLSELLKGLAAETDLEGLGYVKIEQSGVNSIVSVDTDGGGNNYQQVAVLENFSYNSQTNDTVRVLFEDNSGNKHSDTL